MRIPGGLGRWARASNDAALANARAACTTLSRARVEREEVALFLRERRAEQSATTPALRPADARLAGGSR